MRIGIRGGSIWERRGVELFGAHTLSRAWGRTFRGAEHGNVFERYGNNTNMHRNVNRRDMRCEGGTGCECWKCEYMH